MNYDVAVFGEALFDFIQSEDGDYRPYIGGSPYNVARSFARQGMSCHYLSPVSNDHLGEQIFQSIIDEGILVPSDLRSAKTTSLALVYKDASGQPDYRLYRSDVADMDIDADKLLSVIPDDLALFHTGSLAIVPAMQPVLTPIIHTLKARGCKISIDVNVRKGVELDHKAYVNAIWHFAEMADVVKVSDEDFVLAGLTGDPMPHAKALLNKMQDGIVVLTLGEQGAYLLTKDITIQQDIFRPDSFGDTVGAGDTFFSAMLSQMLRDKAFTQDSTKESLAYALKFGSMAAAMNVAEVGCHPPTSLEVEGKLRSLIA